MTLQNARHAMLPPPLTLNHAARKLNQLQADLVSTARMWAVDEVGAAIAHQLNEPLTALLLYLHEIKDQGERSTATETETTCSMREMVNKALRETERVCEILERTGHGVEAPTSGESHVARGREAINWWARGTNSRSADDGTQGARRSGKQSLTPREREVLALVTQGLSNKEGGHQLGISTRTFEVHRAHTMAKLGAKNAADLVRMALGESHDG